MNISKYISMPVLFFVLMLWSVLVLAEEKTAPVDPLSSASIVNMFLGLGLVLAIIFAMAWLVRRMGGMQVLGSQKIRMLGGLSLGAREKVVLVQVENKRLVLGVAQGQVNTLHVLDGDYDIEEDTGNTGTDFKEKLLQALNKTVKKQ